jgi:hypothetical protein
MDWKSLAFASPYRTAVAVQESLRQGNYPEAQAGMEELIDALSRSDRRALKSHLVRLMAHVIKWRVLPEHRSRSWMATIANAREEIAEIQEETPSLTRTVIEDMWEKCFQAARREAEGELGKRVELPGLSWQEVFETEYTTSGTGEEASS